MRAGRGVVTARKLDTPSKWRSNQAATHRRGSPLNARVRRKHARPLSGSTARQGQQDRRGGDRGGAAAQRSAAAHSFERRKTGAAVTRAFIDGWWGCYERLCNQLFETAGASEQEGGGGWRDMVASPEIGGFVG